MQMTPIASCTHGFASADVDGGEFELALIFVLLYRIERTRQRKSRRAGRLDGQPLGMEWPQRLGLLAFKVNPRLETPSTPVETPTFHTSPGIFLVVYHI
jgi:hypothetical protein